MHLLEGRFNESQLQNLQLTDQIHLLQNQIQHLTQQIQDLTQQNRHLTLNSTQDYERLTLLNNRLQVHDQTIQQLREEIVQKDELI